MAGFAAASEIRDVYLSIARSHPDSSPPGRHGTYRRRVVFPPAMFSADTLELRIRVQGSFSTERGVSE